MTRGSEYSRFVAVECHRCGDAVLEGRSGGLHWLLDRFTVQRDHAEILRHYGIQVLMVTRAGFLETWFPPGDLLDRLVVPHICGSAHAAGKRYRE